MIHLVMDDFLMMIPKLVEFSKSNIAPYSLLVILISFPKLLQTPSLLRADNPVGWDLEYQEKEEKQPGLYEKRYSQKANKIGHIHRISGKAIDTSVIKPLLIWMCKMKNRASTQSKSQTIQNESKIKAPRKVESATKETGNTQLC